MHDPTEGLQKCLIIISSSFSPNFNAAALETVVGKCFGTKALYIELSTNRSDKFFLSLVINCLFADSTDDF